MGNQTCQAERYIGHMNDDPGTAKSPKKARRAPLGIRRRHVLIGAGAAASGLAITRVLGLHHFGDLPTISLPGQTPAPAAPTVDWISPLDKPEAQVHHTPNTQVAIDEVYRVLKPGGRAIIMLYHKHSFNYCVRIMAYMRSRVLLKILSRTGRRRVDRERALFQSPAGLRGNTDCRIWKIHYHNFLKEGWSYLKAENFVHHCTDGPECPVAFAFSKTDAQRLFSRFQRVQMKVAHFPLNRYPLGRCLPFGVERFLADKIGWYLFIFASK